MDHKAELRRISVGYLNREGNTAISDLDTPSFIRKEFNLIYREKRENKISGTVPGPVTRLFNTLFGDEEIRFA